MYAGSYTSRLDLDLVEVREPVDGGPVLLDPGGQLLRGSAAALTPDEHVLELTIGHDLLELGDGRRVVSAAEAADRDDRLAGLDDDRRRRLRARRRDQILRGALVLF